MRRRDLLLSSLGLMALGARPAQAADAGELESFDLEVGGDTRLASKARLLLPRAREGALPLLVLLHGLGETSSAALGLGAWTDRYGLLSSHRRLREPPLEPGARGYLTEPRRKQLNDLLAARPFQGMAIACPVTPNVYRRGPEALDRYADWIEHKLLPAVRARASITRRPGGTAIDGCSLGGYVALEVFVRKPELFGLVGSVQGAFSPARALSYARSIAAAIERHGPRKAHVQSSTRDPYRAAAERLARELGRLKVPHELLLAPGPHDQPWLREVGTLELLLWYDRELERSG
jgi:predicted esterase